MAADTSTYVAPRERLVRHFATRAGTSDPATWLAQAWARAVLMAPRAADDAVLDLLRSEWDAYRAEHPGEPLVAFRPPAPLAEEPVVPSPPPYDALPPLTHGRYGVDLPSHEDRVREEQERLSRRDNAYFGF
jgi:hypothetical protein